MPSLSGGFPVDFVVTVAGDVFPQFLEVSSFSNLPLCVQPESAAIEEKRGQILPFSQKVWIDANLAIERKSCANCPEAQNRRCFRVSLIQMEVSAAMSGEWPI